MAKVSAVEKNKRRRKLANAQTRGRLWKHSTLADIDGLIEPEELDELFCFTMVRNPWDRIVSYFHWLRVQSFDHPAVSLANAARIEGTGGDFLFYEEGVTDSVGRLTADAVIRDAVDHCDDASSGEVDS